MTCPHCHGLAHVNEDGDLRCIICGRDLIEPVKPHPVPSHARRLSDYQRNPKPPAPSHALRQWKLGNTPSKRDKLTDVLPLSGASRRNSLEV